MASVQGNGGGAVPVGTSGKKGKKKKRKNNAQGQPPQPAQPSAKKEKKKKKKPTESKMMEASAYPRDRAMVLKKNTSGWWGAAVMIGAAVGTALAFTAARPVLMNNYARSLLVTLIGAGGLLVKSRPVAAASRAVLVVGVATAGMAFFRDVIGSRTTIASNGDGSAGDANA